jgi:tetratricopeptide (TPR) repeat protein
MGSLLIAYLGHNFFVFDTPANSLMFYFFAGCFLVLTNFKKEEEHQIIKKYQPNQFQPLILGLIVIIGGLVIYYCDIKPYQASRLAFEAVSSNSYDLNTVTNYFQRTLDKNTFINTETRKMLADYFYKYLIYIGLKDVKVNKEVVITTAEKIVAELDRGYGHEAMIDFYVYKANIYAQLSRMSIFSQNEIMVFEQKEEKIFLEMKDKWPKRTDFYILYAEDQLFKGNIDKAKEWNNFILEQTPNFSRALWLNAALLVAQGGSAENIFNFINDAVDNGYRWDINEKSDVLFAVVPYLKNYPTLIKFLDDQYVYEKNNLRVSEANSDIDLALKKERTKAILDLLIYLNLQSESRDYEKLISYFEDALVYNDANADYWARLAAAYAKVHNKEGAISAAQKAAELNPDNYGAELPLFIDIVQNEEWDQLP